MVTKYDRRGYRPRRRPLIITTKAVYLLNEKDFRLKRKIPFSNVKSVFVCSRDCYQLTDHFCGQLALRTHASSQLAVGHMTTTADVLV